MITKELQKLQLAGKTIKDSQTDSLPHQNKQKHHQFKEQYLAKLSSATHNHLENKKT